MFTTIRQYTCDPTDVPTIARLVDEHFADAVAAQPGFVAYELIDCGTGDLFAVTVFADRDTARRSSELAAAFVAEHLAQLDVRREANHTGVVLVNRARPAVLETVGA